MCLTYFVVALTITGLTSRIRAQEARVRVREQRLGMLYGFTRQLVEARSRDSLLAMAETNIAQALDTGVNIILTELAPQQPGQTKAALQQLDATDMNRTYTVPLASSGGDAGAMIVRLERALDPEQQNLLETLCRQLALALEREALYEATTQLELNRISETLYDALLDSVSHELKTPLTTMQCAIANLRDPSILTQSELRLALLVDLEDASFCLSRLVANLLDMSRLQSGRLSLNRDWCEPGDIVNTALKTLQHELSAYPIQLVIPVDLPLIWVDFGLLTQAVINLIHNAITHNSVGTEIRISLSRVGDQLEIQVADRGRGIPAESLPHLFEKFYRPPGTRSSGTGLGLSISKGFIEAHGGEIKAANQAEGGVCFAVYLPVTELPSLPIEEEDVPTYSGH